MFFNTASALSYIGPLSAILKTIFSYLLVHIRHLRELLSALSLFIPQQRIFYVLRRCLNQHEILTNFAG